MARVISLQYDRFTDRRTRVRFTPHSVQREDGKSVIRGVATVDDDVARTYYVGHPGFEVYGLAPEAPADQPPPAPEPDDSASASTDAPTPSAHSTEAAPAVSDTPALTDVLPADEPAPVTPTGRGRSRTRS